jgi:hypothetical protein
MSPTRRLPISARHAYALAFDLAARRDPVHSLLVPFLLRAPWNMALAWLPPIEETRRPFTVGLLTIAALIGDFIVLLVVGAMLRFRARSVFNTPAGTKPAPVAECYRLGLARLPWLFVTEIVRNGALMLPYFAALPFAMRFQEGGTPGTIEMLTLVLVMCLFVLPTVFLGFRLSFATEAIVLRARNLAGAFVESFRLTEGRFERWLELIALSVGLAFAAVLVATMIMILWPGLAFATGVAIARVLDTAETPIFQYAWTFFYLRLAEIDTTGVEVGPAYAAAAAADTPMIAGAADASHADQVAFPFDDPRRDPLNTGESSH